MATRVDPRVAILETRQFHDISMHPFLLKRLQEGVSYDLVGMYDAEGQEGTR